MTASRLHPHLPLKILAVEDDTIAGLRLMAVLKSYGHKADLATDGPSAWNKLQEGHHRIVVCDWHLPGFDGLELCRMIRKLGGDYVYFILISAQKISTDNRHQALFAGVDEFMVKPIDHEDMALKLFAAERLLDLLSELRRANAAKNKLLGMVAHDLRNPLAGIRGLSEYLREDGQAGKLTLDQREMVENIHSASDGMLRMVNELLDVSVIDAGELKIDRQPINLEELLERSVALNTITAAKKGSQIHYQPNPIPVVALIDGPKVAQVVDNLLTNAIKFSPPQATITMDLQTTSTAFTITVRDQGPGIPEGEKHKLFQDFSCTSVRPTAGEKSTGLGLAICRKIVEGHLGTIRADNQATGGCAFSFSIPIDQK